MNSRRGSILATLLCAVCLCVPHSAAASPYHGTVIFGGFSIPGATITATRGDKIFTAVSDQGGVYSFDDLPNGQWTIEVSMQCFQTIKQQVTIAPGAPPGKWELTLLPADELMAITKVVHNPVLPQSIQVPAAPASKKASPENDTATMEQTKPPDSSNDQTADGLLVNGNENNAASSRYSTNPAFGNTRPGGHVLYNGGFSTALDNSATDARRYSIGGYPLPKSSYNLITNSAWVGGPIRLFQLLPPWPNFFVNYSWTRDNNAAVDTGLVPTANERTGNLAGLLNAQGQPITIYNPSTGQPYANNQVPVSPQAAALLALYPQPNPNIATASGYNYQVPVLNSAHQDALQSRLTKMLGRRDMLFGGFNFQSTRADNVSLFGFIDRTHSLGVNANIHWNHRFGSRLFLSTAYTFSRSRVQFIPNFASGQNFSGMANIAGNNQDPANWGPPTLNFANAISPLTDGNSSYNTSRTDGFSVSAGIYHGRHNFSIGGDFHKQEYNDHFQQDPRGTFTFTGAATANTATSTATGSALADFLIGVPDTSAIAFGNADKYLRDPVYDAFFTDDWRVMPQLTINAGLRWEYSAPMTELFGRLANLDLNSSFTAGAAVTGANPIGPINGEHYPSSLIRPDRGGIEPRIAVSWRPIPASSLVVRSGYGIYQDTSVYQSIVMQMVQQASLPNTTSFNVQNSAACPLAVATFALPSRCIPSVANTFAIDPNYRIGYLQVWNVTVQRDLPFAMQIVADYKGSKGTHGAQQFIPNTNPIGAPDLCPDCPTNFIYRTSGGNSIRNAAHVQLRRRLRNGFTASLDYTWSKSIDDFAVFGGEGYGGTGIQNMSASSSRVTAIAQDWRNPRAERSLSNFDQRHLLNLSAQYTTGEGLGGGTLMGGKTGKLLKEWTLLGTLSAGTGMPQTPIYPVVVPGTGFTNVIRPSLTGAPLYDAAARTHLNSSAYGPPAPGEWGTAGRDSITGPNHFTLDSSLSRTFRPHGKTYLDLAVNASNLLNHPDFVGWNTVWNGASQANAQQFGRPVAAGAMRSLQTTIRVRF